MRSNIRMLACYLLAMMLVNFHGNLVLRSENITRKKEGRNMMAIVYFFRNLFISFTKIIFAFLLVIGGIIGVLFNSILLITCLLPGKCEAWENFIGSFLAIGLAFVEIADITRIMWTERSNPDPTWYWINKHSLRGRSLSLSAEEQEIAHDINNLKLEDFPERDPYRVSQIILTEGFASMRQVQTAESEVNNLMAELRMANQLKLTTDQITSKFREMKAKYSEAQTKKIAYFKRRLKLIIVPAIIELNETIENEMNPQKFTGEKLKKYQELEVKIRSADAGTAKKAVQEIEKIGWKFNNKNPDFQNNAGKLFGEILVKYGFTEKDGKNTYAIGLIKSGMAKSMAPKISELKKGMDSDIVRKLGGESEKVKVIELETKITKMEISDLPDDSKNAVLIMDNLDEEETNE